jgi:hypothetical protein
MGNTTMKSVGGKMTGILDQNDVMIVTILMFY